MYERYVFTLDICSISGSDHCADPVKKAEPVTLPVHRCDRRRCHRKGGASLMAFGLICGIGQLVLLIPTDVTFWYMKDSAGLSVGDTVKAVCIPSTIAGVVSFVMILIMNTIGTLPMW